MDTMIIGSKLLTGLLSKILQKMVKKKLGINTDICFQDPISFKNDADGATFGINLKVSTDKEGIATLSKLIFGLVKGE